MRRIAVERLTRIYVALLLSSILFAAWGWTRWLQAQALIVKAPVPVKVGCGELKPQKERFFPLARYAELQTGEMFFGKAPEPSPSVKVEFSSELLLYGVTKGTVRGSDRAVVGLTGDPEQQTWLAQAGSVVNGETIVRIEAKRIWVKNQTGEGMVVLKRE
jgi:hypothetical protein